MPEGAPLRARLPDLFPIDGFENPLMAGRTDYWIFTELAKGHGLVPDAATLERIRDAYLVHLAREIHEPAPDKGILPGVRSLLDLLSARDDVTLAILTGNIEQGARSSWITSISGGTSGVVDSVAARSNGRRSSPTRSLLSRRGVGPSISRRRR